VRLLALILSEKRDKLLLNFANTRFHELAACDIVPDVVEHGGEFKVVNLFAALQSDEQVLFARRHMTISSHDQFEFIERDLARLLLIIREESLLEQVID